MLCKPKIYIQVLVQCFYSVIVTAFILTGQFVFRVTGLKILGRVSTHIYFFNYFFSSKKYNFMHFERHFVFQNA